MKTTYEFIQFLKDKDCLKEFMINLHNDSTEKDYKWFLSRTLGKICDAFTWSKTPEDNYFWEDLDTEWDEQYNKEHNLHDTVIFSPELSFTVEKSYYGYFLRGPRDENDKIFDFLGIRDKDAFCSKFGEINPHCCFPEFKDKSSFEDALEALNDEFNEKLKSMIAPDWLKSIFSLVCDSSCKDKTSSKSTETLLKQTELIINIPNVIITL